MKLGAVTIGMKFMVQDSYKHSIQGCAEVALQKEKKYEEAD